MLRRLKVLMVGNLPYDMKSIKGGVEATIINLFHGFSSRSDIAVTHIAFSNEVREETEIIFSGNVRVVFLPFKSRYPLIDYFLNRRVVKSKIDREKPEIIHIQESSPHLLRFFGMPRKNIVVTQHGIMKEELRYVEGIKNRAKFIFKYLIEKYFFPSFRNVIFISEYNRKLFRGTLDHQVQIFNPVNPVFFEKDHVPLQHKQALIYVGVLNRRKNIRLVLEALSALRNKGIAYELNVVGGFKEDDPGYKIEIAKLIELLGIADQVRFHGWLSQEDILKVYKKCSYFVLPSLQETLPISIAEAMAIGKVVLASDVGAISEMFTNQETGFLFARNDLNALVKLLESFSAAPLTADRVSEVRMLALQRYHPAEVVRRTLEFYKEVTITISATA